MRIVVHLVILLTLAALPAGAELTPQEEARLASALAVIEARLGTNYPNFASLRTAESFFGGVARLGC